MFLKNTRVSDDIFTLSTTEKENGNSKNGERRNRQVFSCINIIRVNNTKSKSKEKQSAYYNRILHFLIFASKRQFYRKRIL